MGQSATPADTNQQRLKADLLAITELSIDQVQNLVSALRTLPIEQFTLPTKLLEAIRKSSSDLSDDISKTLRDVIGHLNYALLESGRSTDEMVGWSTSAWDFSESEKVRIAERLRLLLNIEPMTTALQLAILEGSELNRLISMKVVVDVRPFFKNPDAAPSHAVLRSTLIIHYQSHDAREFHVALDENDLHDLREELDRAERQIESLKQWIDATDTVNVTL